MTQRAHALQAAKLAREAGALDEEVIAALLHDVGHLCAAPGEARMGRHGVASHEDVGADHLAALGFGPGVTERVRGHVAAKRYLVATRPDYAARLSEASRATLGHQGGALNAEAQRDFEASPLRDSWLRLRAWDDAAKLVGLEVPDFESWVPLLEAHLRAAGARSHGVTTPA
ncbi:MAG TPA: HD domain-containing protein [Myxococcota bacterium]|nr:HD domain-containing protein [Myxococcota bacterium]